MRLLTLVYRGTSTKTYNNSRKGRARIAYAKSNLQTFIPHGCRRGNYKPVRLADPPVAL